MSDLDTVLRQELDDAAALRRKGDARAADLIEQVVARVTAGAEDWLTWLSEADAALRSGRSIAWHRARFAAWERQGLARRGAKRVREYRRAIIPMRESLASIDREAREAARRFMETAA